LAYTVIRCRKCSRLGPVVWRQGTWDFSVEKSPYPLRY
jgi:hypothetical protein